MLYVVLFFGVICLILDRTFASLRTELESYFLVDLIDLRCKVFCNILPFISGIFNLQQQSILYQVHLDKLEFFMFGSLNNNTLRESVQLSLCYNSVGGCSVSCTMLGETSD